LEDLAPIWQQQMVIVNYGFEIYQLLLVAAADFVLEFRFF
jgi:hypothetical protein